ncbi:hypothetical protein [Streptomyces fungicidicus]|uniref:Uncharacterized protein n=2 Tax=Streptomyces TaxID=1883 RepID=A0ACC7Y8J5_9ACTN|nr:hypothetical protein [Streptomyces fungicidicus]NUV78222.1 hypothetical protein [Streptomyces fungicidicus]
MKLNTQAQVDAAERVLRLSWVIVAGAILFSVFTVTPLVARVTPQDWQWSAWLLPIVVDVAVVISIRVDAIVARLGGSTTGWPATLRVLTGAMSVLLNIGDSALKGDLVGVGVHLVAPALLIVTAEASLKWRREIASATTRIEEERRREHEERRREQRAREERLRADREQEREERLREREAALQEERDRRRDEAAERAAEREHEARLAKEERDDKRKDEAARYAREEETRRREAAEAKAKAEEAKAHEEETRRREAAKAETERRLREPRPAPPAPARTPVSAARTSRPAVSATVSKTDAHEADTDDKMSEKDARKAVADGIREGRSQREIAALTGWSTGWVAKRAQELAVTS